MGRSWTPSAHWMTVTRDGVPEIHGTRWQTIEYAKKYGLMAYRQEAGSARVDVVYDPSIKTEYAPGDRVALTTRYESQTSLTINPSKRTG